MGFIAITGEVGTGKTTVIRSFLEQVDPKEILPVYIFNARVTFKELLHDIFKELGLVAETENISGLVHQLNAELIEKYKNNQNVIMIVDEAQSMPVETLEQLRMLSNLETTKEKLIQIILVGQPELDDKLHKQELRQLRQRVAIRALLKPLLPDESYEYILHRISIVSSSGRRVFSREAIDLIIKSSGGVPRVLNTLCDNALIAAFGYQQKDVREKVVREVLKDYFDRENITNSSPKFIVGKENFSIPKKIAPMVLVVLLLVGFLLLGAYFINKFTGENNDQYQRRTRVIERQYQSKQKESPRERVRNRTSRSAVSRHAKELEKQDESTEDAVDKKRLGFEQKKEDRSSEPSSDDSLIQRFRNDR